MILFTNGDSWTQGDSPAQDINWEATKTEDWYDIVPYFGALYKYYNNNRIKINNDTRILYKFYDSDIWPKMLGKRLGVETWNAGRLGDSNHGIYSTTIQSIEWLKAQGKEDIFAIIGWTSKTRIPIYLSENDELRVEQQRPDNFTLANDLYKREKYIQNEFLTQILSLQNYFNNNNIEYLMFNAFDQFEDFDDHYLSQYVDKTKWVNYNPKAAHFKEYITSKYDIADPITPEEYSIREKFITTNHPTDISHRAWAKYLYNYIQSL